MRCTPTCEVACHRLCWLGVQKAQREEISYVHAMELLIRSRSVK